MTNVRAFIEARDRLAALHTSVGLSDELQSIAVCVLDAVFALMESAAPALSAGEDHDWFDSGLLNGALSCRACGVVKSKCRGAVKVGPREADIAAAVDAATRPDWGRNPAPPAREDETLGFNVGDRVRDPDTGRTGTLRNINKRMTTCGITWDDEAPHITGTILDDLERITPASAADYADVLPRTAKRMQRMMKDAASAPIPCAYCGADTRKPHKCYAGNVPAHREEP